MKNTMRVLISFCASVLSSYAEEGTSENSTIAQPAVEAPKPQPVPGTHAGILNNLYFGGSIHLSFGNYSVIGIEPMLGYRITPKLSAGVTARYDYIHDSRYSTTRDTSQYGGSAFGRYRITDALYAQIEPASYNHELFYSDGSSEREWVPYLFMGGGYRQPIGERSWVYAQILFDVLQDEKSPYDDWTPFLSLGVGMGF